MLNVRFQSLTVRPEITHVLHHLIQSGDSSSSKIRVRVRVTLLILEHLSHSSNIRFRIRVRMIKIRIRNQSASAGARRAPARALVRTSFVGSHRNFFPHHHLFQSITVTQSRSEKVSSDYCPDCKSIPAAHFLGGIASTLAGSREHARREASGPMKIKRPS